MIGDFIADTSSITIGVFLGALGAYAIVSVIEDWREKRDQESGYQRYIRRN